MSDYILTSEYLFDHEYYAAKYQDVRDALGVERAALWNHYQNFGINENRRPSLAYDPAVYRTQHGDLASLSARDRWYHFTKTFEAKYPTAVEKLVKTKELTMQFYDFPAEHWSHIRSTNPIESMFATVRLRTRKTKGCGSRKATLAIVYQLACCAQKRWRALNGSDLMADIVDARFRFKDGIKEAVSDADLLTSNTKF
ncbi:MAG: transposase [Pseudobacteriovorax sp.]|nr:transposase [Pseudobacteriovorax sp.]